jgi:hypothetical protein
LVFGQLAHNSQGLATGVACFAGLVLQIGQGGFLEHGFILIDVALAGRAHGGAGGEVGSGIARYIILHFGSDVCSHFQCQGQHVLDDNYDGCNGSQKQ